MVIHNSQKISMKSRTYYYKGKAFDDLLKNTILNSVLFDDAGIHLNKTRSLCLAARLYELWAAMSCDQGGALGGDVCERDGLYVT